MVMSPRKPRTAEEFISSAKAELQVPVGTSSSTRKDKTFLIRIPYDLWDQARRLAGAEAMPLHNYIIRALERDVQR
jgi:hypothetical protein